MGQEKGLKREEKMRSTFETSKYTRLLGNHDKIWIAGSEGA